MKAINQQQEHTSSYYAATANERTDYPLLEGGKSVDICVVGAGFTGVSTALDPGISPLMDHLLTRKGCFNACDSFN